MHAHAHTDPTQTYTDTESIREVIRFTFQRNGLDPELADSVRVEFTRRLKTTLGKAYGKTFRCAFNAHLWPRATVRERYETIVHEACHLVTRHKYGKGGHGRTWRYCMIQAGVTPRRCHNVDTTGLSRKQKRYELKCATCGHVYEVTAYVIRKGSEGTRRYWCRKCGTDFAFNKR